MFCYGALRISVFANHQDGQMLKTLKCRKSLKSIIFLFVKIIILNSIPRDLLFLLCGNGHGTIKLHSTQKEGFLLFEGGGFFLGFMAVRFWLEFTEFDA